jgi:hypothetical protein
MGHGHHHGRRHFYINKAKLFFIGIFLILSYIYYSKNVLDVIFTTFVQLPLINKVVEGYIYWIIVLVICVGIWKLVDYVRFR